METEAAHKQTTKTRLASEDLAKETNAKLSAASSEVAGAQRLLKQYQEEQVLMTKATILTEPAPSLIKSWKEIISIPLGLSIKFPGTVTVTSSDDGSLKGFSIATKASASTTEWLSILRYDKDREQMLLKEVSEKASSTYLIRGHLLVGSTGKLDADPTREIYVIKDLQAGNSTRLLWIKLIPGITAQTLLQILSTLSFRS